TVESLIEEAPAGIVFTGHERFELDGSRTRSSLSGIGELTLSGFAEGIIRNDYVIAVSAVAIHRDMLAEVGPFSATRRGEDTDLWLRLLYLTYAIFTDEPLAIYHQNPG